MNRRYPKMACALTEYYDFPKAITRPIRSADIIDSLLTEHSAAKIIYSRVIELSSNWWNRTLKDSLPAGKRFRKCLT